MIDWPIVRGPPRDCPSSPPTADRKAVVWSDGQLGGEDLEDMSREKIGDYSMDWSWWLLPGKSADYKRHQRMIQFAVFPDRFID